MGNFTLENQRKLSDANLTFSVSLPAAGSSAYSPSIDTNQSFSTNEKYAVQLDTAATTATTGSITYFVQHSADNQSWSNVPELAPVSIAVTSGSTSFTSDQFRLPPTANEYIRAGWTVSSGASNVQAFNGSFSLRF